MPRTKVKVAWEAESDILEVIWAPGGAHTSLSMGTSACSNASMRTATALGFMVHEFSAHGGPNALEFELTGGATTGSQTQRTS